MKELKVQLTIKRDRFKYLKKKYYQLKIEKVNIAVVRACHKL
jgi:hypothetical protein